MGFDEVRFPVNISLGSKGGPGFSTSIVETDSGAEQRVARWTRPRRHYDVSYGIKTHDDLTAIIYFYIARSGCANGFRFKDWLDFHTNAVQSLATTGTNADEVLVSLGSNNFQLVKRYTSGSITKIRNITKPVSGTVKVASDGSNLTLGTTFTVDLTTGIVNIPSPGAVITGGCEFDVPVRFGKEVDDSLMMSIDDFNSGSISSITLVELIDTGVQDDEFFYGGAFELSTGADFVMREATGRLYVVNPLSSCNAALPPLSGVTPGGPHFCLVNGGSNTITVKTDAADGGGTVISVGAGVAVEFYVTVDAVGTRVWYAF